MFYLRCVGGCEVYNLEDLEDADVFLQDYTSFTSKEVDINFIRANKAKLVKNCINVSSCPDGDIDVYDDFLCDNKEFFKPSKSDVVIGNNVTGVKFDYRWVYGKNINDNGCFVSKVYIKGRNGLSIVDFGSGSANHHITVNNNVVIDYKKLCYPNVIKGHFGYSLIDIFIDNNIVTLMFFINNKSGLDDLNLELRFNSSTGDIVSCSVVD